MSAAIFTITRSWDMAWRSPSLLCAALIAFLLFRSASHAYGNIAGLIAFGAFGFNSLSPRLASLVRSDMPLALVIFLSGLLIWEKIRKQEAWNRRNRLIIFSFLHSALAPNIFPLVRAHHRPGDCRSSRAPLEFSKRVS